ncbi:hypothetical protein NUK36_12685 [Aeromonas hydrophila]|uniref:hypothetical protein n=1 Tax=Aeromonas hydrophila TaxID=644 RepID=UPI00214D5CAC|nr:hypothetical protein [Aeromonas hydrophila]MCR3903677.1 hypothetical protein [Aeromonas hydrophila]
MEHLARAGQLPRKGMAAVWIAVFVILLLKFSITLSRNCPLAASGAIAEVVVAGCRRIGIFLYDAFLAGYTLQVEQNCQILKHIFTSLLCR